MTPANLSRDDLGVQHLRGPQPSSHRPPPNREVNQTPPPPLWAALGVVLATVALVCLACLMLRPPAVRDDTAPAQAFSAGRAYRHISALTHTPRPTGSYAHSQARDYLLTQLTALGLQPQRQSLTVTRTHHNEEPIVASVDNISATLAGTQPAGTIILVAHYDSVPTGLGAADNASSVATLLEIARALKAGPPPRDTITVLFTDGEEYGTLGASGYLDSPAAPDPATTRVINLDARGTSGRAILLQTSGGIEDTALRGGELATSLAADVYRLLPNDTDYSEFAQRGYTGADLVYFDHAAAYHTLRDAPERVSLASVQDMGEAALRTVNAWASKSLLSTGPARALVYFPLGSTTIVWPAWVIQALALLGAVIAAAALARGREVSWRQQVSATATLLGVLVAGAAAGWGVQLLGSQTHPDLSLQLGVGDEALTVAAPALVVALMGALAWGWWATRRYTRTTVAMSVLMVWACAATAGALVLPRLAYPLALALIVAAPLAWATSGPRYRRWVPIAVASLSLLSAIFLAPMVVLLIEATGLQLLALPTVLTLMILAPLAVVLPRPQRRVSAACVIGSLALSVVVTAVVTPTNALHPISLAYVRHCDDNTADWVTLQDQGPATALAATQATTLKSTVPPIDWDHPRSGPAPLLAGAPCPQLRVTGESDGAQRRLTVTVDADPDAYQTRIYLDTAGSEVVTAHTDTGESIPGGRNRPYQEWEWGLTLTGRQTRTQTLTVTVATPSPVRVRVVALHAGLPADTPLHLSADQTWAGWPQLGGETFTVATQTV